MSDKFNFIYNTVTENMLKLDGKKITVEHAKAFASLAKQANNVLATQLDAAKFITNSKDHKKGLEDVGL